MLRLRSEDRFALFTASLSMTNQMTDASNEQSKYYSHAS
jgi:hypothetical protein